jgi:hypothetical protein
MLFNIRSIFNIEKDIEVMRMNYDASSVVLSDKVNINLLINDIDDNLEVTLQGYFISICVKFNIKTLLFALYRFSFNDYIFDKT